MVKWPSELLPGLPTGRLSPQGAVEPVKSRFEFFYVCKGIEFEQRCEFRGVLTDARSESSSPSKRGPSSRAEVRVSLEPLEKEDTKRFIDGRLLVTLPGRPEEVEPLAFSLAAEPSNLINFVHGPTFELQAGLITAERVPETPEEEAEIGDKRWAPTRPEIEARRWTWYAL